MRRLFLIFALGIAAFGQTPPQYTQITDTVYTPVSGVAFQGTVKISAPVLVDANANTIGAWNQTQSVVGGAFNASLVVNPTNTQTVMLFTTYNGASWYEVCDILYSPTPVQISKYCSAQAVSNPGQAVLSIPYPGGNGIPYVTGPKTARVAIDCSDYTSPTCINSGSLTANFSNLNVGANGTFGGTIAVGNAESGGGCVHYNNPLMITASNVHAGAGGASWNAGDTFNIPGGTLIATGQVTAAPGGAVTAYTLTFWGNGYAVASSVTTNATGSSAGTGLLLDITAVGSFDVAQCPPYTGLNYSWNMTMTGDLRGFPWSNTLNYIQGVPVSTNTPTSGQTWYLNPTGDAGNPLWALGGLPQLTGTLAAAQMPAFTTDVTNSELAMTVTGIQNNPVLAGTPAGGALLMYNATASEYTAVSTFFPGVDSTTAWQWTNAAGIHSVLDIDTTNVRVGIGKNNPGATLEVNGSSVFDGAISPNNSPGTLTGTPTSGTAQCWTPLNGNDLKDTICTLASYVQTGTAQTYTFPTAFNTAPLLVQVSGASQTACGTYNASVTTSTLTLPANASMTAQTCMIEARGR